MALSVAKIAGLAGWRRALLAAAAGAVTVLALPPYGFWPALFVGLPVLFLLVEGAGSPWRAATAGWWWAYGHFVAGCYWIGEALLVDIAQFGWMLPFAVFGLPTVFALFPAVAAGLARLLLRRGPGLLLALAGCWALLEIARGHVLTGFPWNPLAVAWIDEPVMAQGAALLGAYGMSGLTVLLGGLPALFLGRPRDLMAARLAVLVLGLGAAFAVAFYGYGRLPGGPAARLEPAVTIRLVQAAIDQKLKHADGERADNFRRHMDLSLQPTADGKRPRIVVWPESALPYLLDASPQLPGILGSIVAENGIALIGAVRVVRMADEFLAWNALYALRHDGTVAEVYDKHHLVPFGEYLPLRGLLGLVGLDKLAAGPVDFSPGPGPRVLTIGDGLPRVLPMICYEAIFPEAAAVAGERPGLLVNVTNDAWFGTSNGPPQHLAQARLRAIEQGLPLARAANTGISALVDPYGRVEQSLGLGVAGIIDGELPAALPPTPYARFGLWLPLLLSAILIAAGLAFRRGTA
ncbi:apolipoprotein N-acyltransferase [Zavarzinia sp.]|uniref:apolipoprotein N-acyltransferase n=1 Tax=Zavarzinia sp. TaxID=2027920 RepID=UPI0035649B56